MCHRKLQPTIRSTTTLVNRLIHPHGGQEFALRDPKALPKRTVSAHEETSPLLFAARMTADNPHSCEFMSLASLIFR